MSEPAADAPAKAEHADRAVVVERNGERREMTARTASPEERPALWERFLSASQGFAKYEQRTTREIPVVILEPRRA